MGVCWAGVHLNWTLASLMNMCITIVTIFIVIVITIVTISIAIGIKWTKAIPIFITKLVFVCTRRC